MDVVPIVLLTLFALAMLVLLSATQLSHEDLSKLSAWCRIRILSVASLFSSRKIRPAVTRLLEAMERDPVRWQFISSNELMYTPKVLSGGQVILCISDRSIKKPFELSLRPYEWKLLAPKIEFLREHMMMYATDAPELVIVDRLRDRDKDEEDPDDCPF